MAGLGPNAGEDMRIIINSATLNNIDGHANHHILTTSIIEVLKLEMFKTSAKKGG